MTDIIPLEAIQRRILYIRGHKVLIDADMAEIYGVTTKRLNEQVKRNIDRFPDDFMFQLTEEEKQEVVANCDHLNKLKFSPTLPYVFTEHGAIMLASVLNSPIAVQTSVLIVRAFNRQREMMWAHKDLVRKLDAMERKYDSQFKIVFDAIRQLMSPPQKPKKRIGFRRENES